MKFYFAYEQGCSGLWGPVLYHHDPPRIKDGFVLSSNGVQRRITTPVAVDYDNEPSFAELQRLYPRKVDEVVRPVEGFQTKDGKFFETENDAEIHETIYSITKAFYEFVKGSNIEKISSEQKDTIVEEALRFMQENREDIIRYLEATKDRERKEEAA